MSKVPMSVLGAMGLVGTFGIGGALGWVALQKLGSRRSLLPAIDAPRETLDLMSTGKMIVYADRRGTGRPLVLLHGIHARASAADTKSFFTAYRGKRPVFAPDLPGYGASDHHDHLYSTALYTFAVMQLLQRITAQHGVPPDVVALSMTSEFAARAARDRPDLFNSLTLVAPTGFASSEPTRRPSELFTPHVADMVYAKVPVPTLVLHGRSDAFARLDSFIARHATTWRARRISATDAVPKFEVRGEMFYAIEDLWSDIAHAQGPIESVSRHGFQHVTAQLR